MFEKGDIIFSEGIGVCKVREIVNLSVNKKSPVPYYHLKSVIDENKVSYIPVNDHQVVLRSLITKEEAMEKQQQEKLPELERREIKYVLEQ